MNNDLELQAPASFTTFTYSNNGRRNSKTTMISPTDDLEQVLSQQVPWESYVTGRLISDADLQLIKRFDKRDAATQESLLTEVRERRDRRSAIPSPPPQ